MKLADIENKFMSQFTEGSKDPVSNVKFVCVQCLKTLVDKKLIKKSIVKELVNPLSREDDDDVQYFASQCLEACA